MRAFWPRSRQNNRRFGSVAAPWVTLRLPDAGWSSSVARWAHNPEVAGSNPVPATSGNDPRGATSGVIFMPDGNGFGNVRITNRLAFSLHQLCRGGFHLGVGAG